MLSVLRGKRSLHSSALDEGLSRLGLDGTQHLIIHASLRSFGQVEGGANTVVDALIHRSATVMAPAFTYGTLLRSPTAVARQEFRRTTRVSRDIGQIPQNMVERPEALRSFHPTLSFIAIGEAAQAITAAQTLASPYQPIGELYRLDGYALLLGTQFDSNTTIHFGEHLAGMPLLTRYVPLGGSVVPTSFPNCSADFGTLEGYVQSVATTKIGSAGVRLYRVRDLVDQTVRLLGQNPEALLCTDRYCRCREVRDMVRQYGLRPRPEALR